MNSRKNRKLAHLMNAPGIGRRKDDRRNHMINSINNVTDNDVNNSQGAEELQSVQVITPFTQVLKRNKACSFAPECEDFGQRTATSMKQDRAEYEKLLIEQYGFGLNPISPVTTADQRVFSPEIGSGHTPRKETSSQCVEPISTTDRSTDGAFTDPGQWSFIDSVDDVDNLLNAGKARQRKAENKATKENNMSSEDPSANMPREVHVAQVPRIKVIAEKYIKLKNNNIEVRKLEEQIVCLEYDVYDKGTNMTVPVQTMRAYFSVSTGCEQCSDECTLLNELSPELKDKIKVDPKNLTNIREKDIEIINETVGENYVSDLRHVLLRKEALFAKKKTSKLDLNYLYDMAKSDSSPLDHNFSKTNLLSKKELQEIKKLILDSRESPANNISRKTIKDYIKNSQDFSCRPQSRDEIIIYDLLRALEQK